MPEEIIDGNGKTEQKKPKDIVLTITLKVAGGLEVQGPGNKELFDVCNGRSDYDINRMC